MDKLYDLKDIQQFLLKKDILWGGDCKKISENSYYDEITADVLFATDRNPKEISIEVSPISFVISEELSEICYEDYETSLNEIADYSQEWITCLISKSPENAKAIKAIAESKISKLNSKHERELSGIEAQKSLCIIAYNHAVKPWNNVIAQVNKLLPQNTNSAESEPEIE